MTTARFVLRTETLEALCHLCDAIAQITKFSVANYQVKWAEKQSQSVPRQGGYPQTMQVENA